MSISVHTDPFAREKLPPKDQWPELLLDLPELQYPEQLNCASWLIDAAVEEGFGEKTAIFHLGCNWTYLHLLQQANRIANVLVHKLGVMPGNRVLLRAPNHPMLAAAWLAVMKCGGIAVTTMPLLRSRELAVIANKAEVGFAICDSRLRDELDMSIPLAGQPMQILSFGDGQLEKAMAGQPVDFVNVDTAVDDVALLGFTSGTTGEPKATMHFHRDVLAMSDVVARNLLETNASDVYAGSPPLGFTYGLGALLVFPLRFRAAVALIEQPTPSGLLEHIEKFRVTTLFTAPVMYRAMIPEFGNHDTSSLKNCMSAGEALPKATFEAWFEATGIRIMDGIGATELIHVFIGASGADIRPGATGKPLPGYTACVLDENDQPQGPGHTGRLAVKGPTGCRYLSDSRQLAYVVDGWNVTGDRYRIDEDGYFWFETRDDDMILSSGYNIAGPEVESALLEHEAVSECAVVGWPDADRGHIVKAYIVTRPRVQASDALRQALQEFVKQTIAPYKYPRAIEFIAELPKTQSGKIQRYLLREQA